MNPESSTKIKARRLLVMAAGTGGHVFPAMAVAAALQQQGWDIYWLGTHHGIEARLIPEQDFKLLSIPVAGIRGKGLLRRVSNLLQLGLTFFYTLGVFFRVRPQLVLGMGGYVSGLGGIVSWLLRKPLVIHEQNAIPGWTNRFLAKFANRILQSFPHTFTASPKLQLTGNPVRSAITAIPQPADRLLARDGQPIRLLILGGSQGAKVLNEVVPAAVGQLARQLPLEVYHQCGLDNQAATQNRYGTAHPSIRVSPFITDMAEAYEWADLVICRAGATTIAELMTVGLGSILIPYPHAVDDHQTRNAEFLQQAQAALLLPQLEATPEKLVQLLQPLVTQRQRLLALATAARSCAIEDATSQVVKQCLGVVND